MSKRDVTFFHPNLSDPSQFDEVNLDRHWTRLKSARSLWITHTYVRLRQAGHRVRITNSPPADGIAIVFARDIRRFLASYGNRRHPLTVCAQADVLLPEVSVADVIVQHNGFRADGRRRFYIPNWPQPGLVPRDPSRGNSVRTVSYKGNLEQLHKDFLTKDWSRFLDQREIQFTVDANIEGLESKWSEDRSPIKLGSASRWHDFSDTDVVLAVRPPRRDLYRHKPAVKLVNSWHARVPALLGQEYAFRELRQAEADYLEVSSLKGAVYALDRLCDDSKLYASMVQRGVERAAEFTVERILNQWELLLFKTLTDYRPNWIARITQPSTVPLKRMLRGLQKRIS